MFKKSKDLTGNDVIKEEDRCLAKKIRLIVYCVVIFVMVIWLIVSFLNYRNALKSDSSIEYINEQSSIFFRMLIINMLVSLPLVFITIALAVRLVSHNSRLKRIKELLKTQEHEFVEAEKQKLEEEKEEFKKEKLKVQRCPYCGSKITGDECLSCGAKNFEDV